MDVETRPERELEARERLTAAHSRQRRELVAASFATAAGPAVIVVLTLSLGLGWPAIGLLIAMLLASLFAWRPWWRARRTVRELEEEVWRLTAGR